MEGNAAVRYAFVAAAAPMAWGTTYIITEKFLPPDRPLFAAFIRALSAGLVLLALTRTLPRGDWWWKSLVLGISNIGLFFPLIFLSAYHLPGGLAATIQAASPLAVMGVAFVLIHERPTLIRVAAAVVGLLGVCLLVLQSPDGVTALGLAGAFGSVLISGVGFVLVKKWHPPVPMLTAVSWQLIVGGLFVLPFALVFEGGPPDIDAQAAAGYLWIGVMGTIVAYTCWYTALTRLPAGAVALVGLLNPVVGTVLGVAFAAEAFRGWQALGMALVLGGVIGGQYRTRANAPSEPPA